MRKILLIFFSVILLCIKSYCQSAGGGSGQSINSSYFNNHVPKNPETSSLGAFGNTPVNYYTGLPEVSFGLMTLKGRELELPVSVNYDATGVRTDELSGPVGLKWNLNAGGNITRNLNGLPDEDPSVGYWKTATETNYYQTIPATSDLNDWVSKSENNTADVGPDEFIININGRTIKFVFDKDGNAVVIPRQNILISKTLTLDKISQFTVTLEDGIKYTFGGGTTPSVEERKIENFRIAFKLNYDQWYCNWYGGTFGYTPYQKTLYYWGTIFSTEKSDYVKTINLYNSKWYLTSIVPPSQSESISFKYVKGTDIKYVTRPSTVRIAPVMVTLATYSFIEEECITPSFLGCQDTQNKTFNFNNLPAVAKFPKTNPGSQPSADYANLISLDDAPAPWFALDESQTHLYFKPDIYSANPGGVNEYHSLITESNIRLNYIESSNGSKISFISSSREDLPNSWKYDAISLYNIDNTVVKSIRLNYSTVNANEQSDLLWIGEAYLLRMINGLASQSTYYANIVKQYPESAITDASFLKFVYEGLKDYNYKRTFLESIEDITNEGSIKPLKLCEFTYYNRDLLKRRTTTLHDYFGFQRTGSTSESWEFLAGKTAAIGNSYLPNEGLGSNRDQLIGSLIKIKYPTNGSTNFTYKKSSATGFKLQFIQDIDENNIVVKQREIEYISAGVTTLPVFHSYQDFKINGTTDWMKYKVMSSSPQNDSYGFTHGAIEGNKIVKVYQGTKAANSGYEQFTFRSPVDAAYRDVLQTIYSSPTETNTNGDTEFTHIFPFPRNYERDYLRGLLELRQVYGSNSATTPLHETYYYYDINPNAYAPTEIKGFKGGSFVWTTSDETSFWYGHQTAAQTRYRYSRYSYFSDWVVLSSTKEVMYDQSDPSKTSSKITAFTYDNANLQQIQEKTYLETNPSQSLTTKTKYVTHSDYSSTIESYPETAAIIKLKEKHQISTPIEMQTWLEQGGTTRLISSVAYKYAKVGSNGFVKPSEVWSLNRPLLTSEYNESKVTASGQFALDDIKMRKVHSFNSYHATKGNILGQTSLDGIASTYTWDATYSQITAYTINPTGQYHRSNYIHRHMVGPTTITDPNGINTHFNYDARNRLRLTRDYENNITNRYRYHYISENKPDAPDIYTSGDLYTDKSIIFSTSVFSTDFGVTTYKFEFGDGGQSSGGSTAASHVYSSPGTYTVYLHITNPENQPITVSKQITILPGLVASVCADGPVTVEKCSGNVFQYGTCANSINNTPTSTTHLKATVSGGCQTGYVYKWEYQRVTTACGTDSWVTLANGTQFSQITAPTGFINRDTSCGDANYNIKLTVSDQCGGTISVSTIQLAVFKNGSC